MKTPILIRFNLLVLAFLLTGVAQAARPILSVAQLTADWQRAKEYTKE